MEDANVKESIIEMSVREWASIPDNPRQCNTEANAIRAAKNHLREPSPTHKWVHMAELPNGRRFKLDGHTRALLWSQGKLQAPSRVYVTVYQCESLSDVCKLYDTFDSSFAAENANDRLFGALREHDIIPAGLLLTGGISTACKIISPNATIHDFCCEWKPELVSLSSLTATSTAMPAPLIAAAIVSIRKYGEEAIDFWVQYSAGLGKRLNGKSCGVDELTRIVSDLRARRKLVSSGAQGMDIAGRAASCVEAWIEGRMFVQPAKRRDFRMYVNNVKDAA